MNAVKNPRLQLAVAMALAVAATSVPAAEPPVAPTGGLEEVTVTATRRGDTALQETPVAVTAVTASDLERLTIRDLGDVAASVPNFSAARITAFNAASFAMRGVGQTDIIVYLDAPVGVTVDDFVMPSVQTQLLDPFDLAGIEVLRGPQGTLFGKNTTGGVVNVRTKRPDLQAFGSDVRFSYGSFNTYVARGAVDVPVIDDRLAFRFAGSYTSSDGYYRNGAAWGPMVTFVPTPQFQQVYGGAQGRGDGRRLGGDDIGNARLKALWKPMDAMNVLFQYEFVRDRSDTVPAFNDTPAGPQFVWNLIGVPRPGGDPLDSMAATLRNDLLLGMADGQRIDTRGWYVNLDWTLGDYTLYSVSGYRTQDERLPNTYTGAAPRTNQGQVISLFDAMRGTDRATYQQEVRLASNLAGPLNYVLGGFWQRNDAEFCVVQALGFLDLLGVGAANGFGPNFFNDNPQILCNRQYATTYAGFVDGTYQFNEQFSLGAGFRWTREEKRWQGRPQGFFQQLRGGFDPNLTWRNFSDALQAGVGNYPVGVVTNERTWSEPTWQVTPSWRFNDDVFGYFKVSRGFKSGGYNDQTGTAGQDITGRPSDPYDPEYATSYELGLKTDWLGNRVRFNPTIFYVKYSDAQRALNSTVTNAQGGTFQETRFFNAADVTVKGVEVEFQAALTPAFVVRAALGYQDAKYDRFEADTNFDGTIDQVLSGLPVPRAPEWSGSVDATYTVDLATGRLDLNAQFVYEDANVFYYSDAGRAFDAILDQKNLVNASVTFTGNRDAYYVRLFGRNLTDERYRVASQAVATLWTHTQWGAPRNYGVEVGTRFGGARR